jgi:FixJ family two-component response regulator
LRESTHDVVVCDFDSPAIRGLVALRIVREAGLDLPFIFVSSAPDIGAAVAAIKAGADDYLLDSDLTHLAPSVRHEVARARERALRHWAQIQVRATLARMELH